MFPHLFLPLQINNCSETLLAVNPGRPQCLRLFLFLLSPAQASTPAEREEKIGLVLPGPQLAHAEAELNLPHSADTTRQPGAKIFCGRVRRDSHTPLLIERHGLRGEVMPFIRVWLGRVTRLSQSLFLCHLRAERAGTSMLMSFGFHLFAFSSL